MTLHIHVVGLGRMGLPISVHLTAAGFDVTGYDLSADARERATKASVSVSSDARMPADVNVLVTVLPGTPELYDVMTGWGGLIGRLCPGSTWLDFTSADPRVTTRIAGAAAGRKVHNVGAPMLGGPADAAAGTLGFYLGGDPHTIAQMMPLLEAVGDSSRFLHCGPNVADGYLSKLIANTLWFGQVAAVSEMLLLGQRSGLNLDTLHRVLKDSPAGSVFLTQHAGALLAGDYLPSFGVDRVVEELQTVTDLATEAGTPLELTRLVTRLHEQTLERFGPVNGELLVAKLLEEQAGTTLRHPSQTAS